LVDNLFLLYRIKQKIVTDKLKQLSKIKYSRRWLRRYRKVLTSSSHLDVTLIFATYIFHSTTRAKLQ